MASIPPHVVVRNSAIVGCSMAGSDTVSQHFERAGREDGTWDRVRSLRMGVVGLCMSGPVSQLQHVCLERAFPGVSTGAVIAKVIAGAAIAPATIALNFTGVAVLKGQGSADIREKVTADVAPTWLTGVCHWSQRLPQPQPLTLTLTLTLALALALALT